MEFKLGPLRQIALPSTDLGKSIHFYRETLGLELIAQYDPPGLVFFQLGSIRLLLEYSGTATPSNAVLYFEVSDIQSAYSRLAANGVEFNSAPHMIFRDEKGTFGPAGEEEWMAFFKDPNGHVLALSSRELPI